MVIRVILWLFAAIVVAGAICFVVLDAMDKVESIQKRAPWIKKFLERRSSLVGLLMLAARIIQPLSARQR